MNKSFIATLYLGLMATTSLPALAQEPVYSCVVNIEVGSSMNIECYESNNLSALEARCERRRKTFFNAKDYRVEKNKTCPTNYYGVCLGKKVGDIAQYFYAAPSKPPFPAPNIKSLQEHHKEMCESVQGGVWKDATQNHE